MLIGRKRWVHYLVMGTLVFGLLYVWLFSLLDSAFWVTGGLIGLGLVSWWE